MTATRAKAAVDDARKAVEDAKAALEVAQKNLDTARSDSRAATQAMNDAGTPMNTAELGERLEGLEATNAAIRSNNTARAKAAERQRLREAYESLTKRIQAIDERKAQALAAAVFPVEGLGFDDTDVTYQGVPLSQASSAEQIRVSVAMAMALNPELRVLRIMDGSLLDSDAMEAIRAQVADGDFQVWIERVGDADDGAVIIEDGQVSQ